MPITNLAQLLINFFLRYFFAALLTGVVITFLLPVIIFDITFSLGILNSSLKVLALLGLVDFANGNINLDKSAVMEIFFKLSLVFFILSEAIRFLVKIIFKKRLEIAVRAKVIIVLFLLTVVYGFGFLSIPWMSVASGTSRGSFVFIFLFFYIAGAIAVVLYFLLQKAVSTIPWFFNKLKIN